MTRTSAATGLKSQFTVGNGVGGGSTTYTKVGEVKSISGLSISREALDATHLESPDDFREFIAGLMDTSALTISFNYVPAAGDVLFAKMIEGAGDFEMIYPNGFKIRFSGIPTDFKPGEPSTDVMVGEFTVKPSGKPELVPPSEAT